MADHLATIPLPNNPSFVERSDDGQANDEIVKEAKDRFKHCAKWEYTCRQYFLDDIKFENADAYNGYQWPNDIRRNRDVDERPCLTINNVRQYNLHIVNDIKQNLPEIKIWATGNGATAESASMLQALMRQIAYRSNALVAYDTAVQFMVGGGIGYLRVVTDYVGPDTFDQEVLIKRVEDPLTIYLDPEAKELDKSDARYAFIFDDVIKEEFDKLYPEYAEVASSQNSIDDEHGWVRTDYIRVCEYFRKVAEDDVLYAYVDQQSGQTSNIRKSVLEHAPDLLAHVEASPGVRSRQVKTIKIEWHFIIGTQVVDTKIFPGKYIPIVPVLGEETVIDGIMDRRGHTRAQIEPQRMYNYFASASVEYVALQTKSPWIAPVEAIEGYESYWNTANKVNHSILPFNGIDDAGNPIPPPQRVEPPQSAPAMLQGMQAAQQQQMMVTGQYADSMGGQSNERSAKAINERQSQGDKSTFHYRDNLSIAVRCLGKIVLGLVPLVYDTSRVLQAFAEDGSDFQLEIDPRAQQVYAKKLQHDGKVAAHVLNPTIGMYEVQADTGPNWGTRREEAFNALSLILTQAPQLTSIIGDLLLQSSDFDKANEAAARLRRMVPPQALGEGPTVQEQQLQQQVQQLQQLLQKAMQQLSENALKIKGHAEKRDIDVANALTAQLNALLSYKAKVKEPVDPKEIERLIQAATQEALRINPQLEAIIAENDDQPDMQQGQMELPLAATQAPPPIKGARQGADGHWYVRSFGQSPQYTRLA